MEIKAKRYKQRKARVRSRITGTASRPRLSVYKSSVHIYGQLIDDDKQVTLISASDLKSKKAGGTEQSRSAEGAERSRGKKIESAEKVGEELARRAFAKKIKKVTFDRNGFKYHGRVKALAEGARKGGLEF
jgi:large subunit ribosomal protein L18